MKHVFGVYQKLIQVHGDFNERGQDYMRIHVCFKVRLLSRFKACICCICRLATYGDKLSIVYSGDNFSVLQVPNGQRQT